MNLEHVRRLLLYATLLAIPFLAGLWAMAPPGSYEAWGYPLLAVYLVGVVVAYAWTRIRVARILITTLSVVSIFWLGMFANRIFTIPASASVAERATPDLYMVFVMLSITAYQAFPTRVALWASAGLLASTSTIAGVWCVWSLLQGRPLASVAGIWTYQAILVVSLLVVYILARSKDHHADALLEAARLRDMAFTDTLTSLPNRRVLEEQLERAVAAAATLEQPVSVVFIDLDGFKRVNDVHGHAVGDAVLTQVGDAVRALLRADDVFGRWGGEEYLIVAPWTRHDRALQLAERVRRGVAAYEFTGGVRVTASFGVATSVTSHDASALLLVADQRLYQAKREGRNRVVGNRGTFAA